MAPHRESDGFPLAQASATPTVSTDKQPHWAEEQGQRVCAAELPAIKWDKLEFMGFTFRIWARKKQTSPQFDVVSWGHMTGKKWIRHSQGQVSSTFQLDNHTATRKAFRPRSYFLEHSGGSSKSLRKTKSLRALVNMQRYRINERRGTCTNYSLTRKRPSFSSMSVSKAALPPLEMGGLLWQHHSAGQQHHWVATHRSNLQQSFPCEVLLG